MHHQLRDIILRLLSVNPHSRLDASVVVEILETLGEFSTINESKRMIETSVPAEDADPSGDVMQSFGAVWDIANEAMREGTQETQRNVEPLRMTLQSSEIMKGWNIGHSGEPATSQRLPGSVNSYSVEKAETSGSVSMNSDYVKLRKIVQRGSHLYRGVAQAPKQLKSFKRKMSEPTIIGNHKKSQEPRNGRGQRRRRQQADTGESGDLVIKLESDSETEEREQPVMKVSRKNPAPVFSFLNMFTDEQDDPSFKYPDELFEELKEE